jgi:hypothetical protein
VRCNNYFFYKLTFPSLGSSLRCDFECWTPLQELREISRQQILRKSSTSRREAAARQKSCRKPQSGKMHVEEQQRQSLQRKADVRYNKCLDNIIHNEHYIILIIRQLIIHFSSSGFQYCINHAHKAPSQPKEVEASESLWTEVKRPKKEEKIPG